jgi:hypothetical protein
MSVFCLVHGSTQSPKGWDLLIPELTAHGHDSTSGLFLPLVRDYARVARLVYLAAAIPQLGESFLSQFKKSPDIYKPDFVGKDPTKDAALALHFFFHDCSPEVAQWALSTLPLMFAKQAMIEETPRKEWPNVPVSYISCTEERVLNPEPWEGAARESSHFPHVSRAHPVGGNPSFDNKRLTFSCRLPRGVAIFLSR